MVSFSFGHAGERDNGHNAWLKVLASRRPGVAQASDQGPGGLGHLVGGAMLWEAAAVAMVPRARARPRRELISRKAA